MLFSVNPFNIISDSKIVYSVYSIYAVLLAVYVKGLEYNCEIT